MIQSVWDRMSSASKYVMISTWLHIRRDEQKPSCALWMTLIMLWPAWSLLNVSVTSLQLLAGSAVNKHQVYVLRDSPLASQCSTHNQYNKYLEAVWANWQAGDWCGCKGVGWMDGTDQPDEVRKRGSHCIWPNWSPIKQGIDITQ